LLSIKQANASTNIETFYFSYIPTFSLSINQANYAADETASIAT
jgi:hypothetical protein